MRGYQFPLIGCVFVFTFKRSAKQLFNIYLVCWVDFPGGDCKHQRQYMEITNIRFLHFTKKDSGSSNIMHTDVMENKTIVKKRLAQF